MRISAFILAAGAGTRLFPFSKYIPKPMLPLLNKPILFHSIERLLESGISDIGIIVNINNHMIFESVQTHFQDVNVRYIVQKEILGTANAVLQIKEHLETENFIVIAGDSLFSSSFLKELYTTHLSEKNVATLSLEEMDFELMKASSTVDFRNGRVLKIREKPQTKEELLSNLNSSALYVFSSEIFKVLGNIPKSERGEYELASAINRLIEQNYKVGGLITERVCHISTPYDLWHFNMQFLHETEKKDVNGNLLGLNVKISKSSSITNTIIGNNTEICDRVKLNNCVVLANTLIDHNYENSLINANFHECFN